MSLWSTVRGWFKPRPSPWRVATWPDLWHTLTAVHARVLYHYGPVVADAVVDVKIRVRAGYTLSGLYTPEQRLVSLNADARTAHASALRHELYQHRLPHVLGKGPNREHGRAWAENQERLERTPTRLPP